MLFTFYLGLYPFFSWGKITWPDKAPAIVSLVCQQVPVTETIRIYPALYEKKDLHSIWEQRTVNRCILERYVVLFI